MWAVVLTMLRARKASEGKAEGGVGKRDEGTLWESDEGTGLGGKALCV
jgi:hypothetical protein